MKPRLLRLAVLCLLAGLSGCNLLVPAIFLHPGTKKVPPEFARLTNTKTLVMVWAEPETLYDYPYVRLELSTYISDKIRAGVEGVQVVNARKVEDYIQSHPLQAVDPRTVGQHFEADMVVYVELLEFQIRDPEAPDLLQGKARGAVRVHDLTAEADEFEFQELEEVEVTFPEQPAFRAMTAPTVIRGETYQQFAELVARKFYAHEEEI
jgi:hypothetical protein